MPHANDAIRSSRSSGSNDVGVAVHVHNDDAQPDHFINVRLTNGASFYTATAGSGTAAEVTADQGAPTTLGSAWPVKLTDGSTAFGALASPLAVILASGSDAVGTSTHPMWVTGTVHVDNPSGGGVGGNVTAVSGSVTGLLLGGVAVAGTNPLPVTGTIHLADVSAITGTVALSQGVAISSLPNVTVANPQTTVTVVSGSVSGLLYGGVAASSQNPFWVTGSVGVTNNPSSQTVLSGSVVGLMVGGVTVSSANPVPTSQQGTATVTGSVGLTGPITGTVALSRAVDVATMPNLSVTNVVSVTGTVHMADVSAVTGTVALARSVDVATLPAVSQGTAAALNAPWRVQLVSGGDVVGQSTNPLWVTGSVFVINMSAGGAASNVTAVSGSVVGLLLGGQPVAGGNPLPVTGSVGLTGPITGTVALSQGVAISSLPNVTVANPQTTVTVVSGSVSGLLLGGLAVAASNPIPVTGTVHLADVSAITGSVTLAAAPHVFHDSGSITGLLVGGVAVSNVNPVPVSQQGTATITGSVGLTGPITGTVALSQGVAISALPAVTVQSGSVTGLLLGGLAVAGTNPVPVAAHSITSGSVTGLLVGGQPVSRSNIVPVAKYDVYGAAELSGVFYSQGFKASQSATSGSTTVVSTTNIGNRITVTSLIVNPAFTVPAVTMFWFASTSSAGLTNLTHYYMTNGNSAPVVLPYHPNGWMQTGLCQANSTASLLLMANVTASLGVTLTYFVTP